MATIADSNLPKRRTYPWGDFFNGKPWKLVEGEDYDDLRSFRAMCYRKAKEYGVKVRTKMSKDWMYLTIQAEPSELSWKDGFKQ